MGKFAKAETQAKSVANALYRAGDIKSLGTRDTYQNALIPPCQFMKDHQLGSLRDINPEQATQYLKLRGEEVGQSQLDKEHNALQLMMRHLTHQLDEKDRLLTIQSEHPQILTSRAYNADEIKQIAHHQTERNALATEIAAAAGLRAHELLLLRPANELRADTRPGKQTAEIMNHKFQGMEGKLYTIDGGKGGLKRNVTLPALLAERLEQRRYPNGEYKQVKDRRITYKQYYDMGGGKAWSSSFSKAAKRILGFSHGAHGTRHTYAQTRMDDLKFRQLVTHDTALAIVSQEMGHFRPSVTVTYLR